MKNARETEQGKYRENPTFVPASRVIHRRGAVIVEFALAFPILLITFVFIIQVLNVFTYDVLGSYASFAAARAYSVQRNAGWDKEAEGEVFDVDGARRMALERSYAVAASIMATYSMPNGRELRTLRASGTADDPDSPIASIGIADADKIAAAFVAAGAYPSENSFIRSLWSAHLRMAGGGGSFAVTEFSDKGADTLEVRLNDTGGITVGMSLSSAEQNSFFLPMKAGYAYPESRKEELPELPGWFDSLIISVTGFFTWLFGGSQDTDIKEVVGFPAKVAQVHFTYRYPTVLTQLNRGYLAADRLASQKSLTIPIYQSSASPIEPVPADLAERLAVDPRALDEGGIGDLKEEKRERENAVEDALTALWETVVEIGVDLGTRPDRETWNSAPQWRVATPRAKPAITWINPSDHPAKPHELVNLYKAPVVDDSFPPERRVEILNAFSAMRTSLDRGWSSPDGWLLDPFASLTDEIDYRYETLGWIQEEITSAGRIESEAVRAKSNLNRTWYKRIYYTRPDGSRGSRRVVDTQRTAENRQAARDTIARLIQQYEASGGGSDWESRASRLITEVRADLDKWRNREEVEKELLDSAMHLLGDLRDRLLAAEESLTEYYEFVLQEMVRQADFLEGLKEAMGR